MIKIGEQVDFILNNARFHGTVCDIKEEGRTFSSWDLCIHSG